MYARSFNFSLHFRPMLLWGWCRNSEYTPTLLCNTFDPNRVVGVQKSLCCIAQKVCSQPYPCWYVCTTASGVSNCSYSKRTVSSASCMHVAYAYSYCTRGHHFRCTALRSTGQDSKFRVSTFCLQKQHEDTSHIKLVICSTVVELERSMPWTPMTFWCVGCFRFSCGVHALAVFMTSMRSEILYRILEGVVDAVIHWLGNGRTATRD